jgi:hypothetical protein
MECDGIGWAIIEFCANRAMDHHDISGRKLKHTQKKTLILKFELYLASNFNSSKLMRIVTLYFAFVNFKLMRIVTLYFTFVNVDS